MKVAVSIPDDVFQLAERKARQLKVTRSQLYAAALAEYLRKELEEELTARVDATVAQDDLDEGLVAAQARATATEWTW
ncbi:MAG TPA: ChpI protein [Candidatus Dormibacteraeota bacterium]|nr:ChpI protein [Candidatus Dormibacteraeota bacterium]